MYKLNEEELICINGGPEEPSIDDRLFVMVAILPIGTADPDDPKNLILTRMRSGMETSDGEDGNGVYGRAP